MANPNLALIGRRTESGVLPHGAATATPLREKLVGYSPFKEIEAVAPGMANNIKAQGMTGPAFMQLIRRNPGKATVVGAAAAIGSDIAYDQLMNMAQSSDVSVKQVAEKALEQVNDMLSQAHIHDSTPNEDGAIAGIKAEDVKLNYTLVREAEKIYNQAVAAAGGRNRLEAICQWIAIDDDLKAIVLEAR